MFSEYVSYDRKAKSYVLDLGDMQVQTGPGPIGKLKALKLWINDQSPALLDHVTALIEANPHISKRAFKAAEIALSGMVRYVPSGWMVVSSKGDGEYHVAADEYGRKSCGCHDFNENENPVFIQDGDELVKVCKHVLAVDMWLKFVAPY